MKLIFSTLSAFIIFSIIFISACKENTQQELVLPAGDHFGESQQFGNGTMTAFINLNANGKPRSIGVAFYKNALEGLSSSSEERIILQLPTHIPDIPFNHLYVNWHPTGNSIPGLNSVPFIDFYFYTISPEEREAITANSSDYDKIANLPASQYVPKNYIPLKLLSGEYAGFPKVGLPWLDSTSAIGATFTDYIFYGSYNGNFIFWDPAFSLDYLISTKSFPTKSLEMPLSFVTPGYYPTKYNIQYKSSTQSYKIILTNMQYFE